MLLTGLSGYATFTGMVSFTDGGLDSVVYAAWFTAAIQGLILFCLWGIVQAGGGRGIACWLVPWAAATLVSVALGFGFFFERIAGDAHARGVYRQVVGGDVAQPLVAFQHRYRELADATAELAAYSAEQAERERHVGGTCQDGVGAGPGPRMRLRQRDAEMLEAFGAHFERRGEAMTRLVADARAALDGYDPRRHDASVQAAEAALAEGRALAADPRLEAFCEAAAERLRAGREGIRDPQTDVVIVCPDDRLETLLRVALRIELPALPDSLGEVYRHDRGAAVQRAFALLIWGPLGRLLGVEDPPVDGFELERDGLPMAIGFGVDIALLLLLALWRRQQLGPGGPGGRGRMGGLGAMGGLARALEEEPELDEGRLRTLATLLAVEEPREILAVLRAHLFEGRHGDEVVLPVDGGGPGTDGLRLLLRVLAIQGDARRTHRMRPGRVPRWWGRSHPEAVAAERLDVWRLRPGVVEGLILDLLRRRPGPAAPRLAHPRPVEPPIEAAE